MTRGQEFLLRALANGRELHQQLSDLLVSKAYRVESFCEVKRGIRDCHGMKQWLTSGAAKILALGSGKI